MSRIRLGDPSPRRRWLLRLLSNGIPGYRPRAGHERYSLGRPFLIVAMIERRTIVKCRSGVVSVAMRSVTRTVYQLTVTHTKIEVTVTIIERRAAPPGSGICLDGIPAEPDFPLLPHV